jgi:hypothetical protein
VDGIFLHTGWRTAGTWIWSRLREHPQCRGFYEPLHEMLPDLTAAQIEAMDSRSWNSLHTATAPYFLEYLPLLRRDGGVAGARAEFAFDRYFLDPDAEQYDLRRYLRRVWAAGREGGRLPVLKFTRSLGRVGWLRRQFPEAAHVVVLRQPWAQFRSAWRCLVADGNPYFLAAPIVVLARNAGDPAVAALVRALDLPVSPTADPAPMAHVREIYRLVPGMPAAALYGFAFALWLLGLGRGLPAADFALDGDADPGALAAMFHAETGLAFDPGAARRPAAPRAEMAGGDELAAAVADCHRRAIAALDGRIDPVTLARLAPLVEAAERAAGDDLAAGSAAALESAVGAAAA